MHETAFLISILISILISMFLPFWVMGKQWRAAEEKALARRLADARMDARLVRLNL
jgi:type II secretory pathway pseudopilin PulG